MQKQSDQSGSSINKPYPVYMVVNKHYDDIPLAGATLQPYASYRVPMISVPDTDNNRPEDQRLPPLRTKEAITL